MIVLYISCDNLVTVANVMNKATGLYVTNATVTMTLRDSAKQAISAATNLSLAYVAGTVGTYQGMIPDVLALTEDARYYLDVSTAVGSYNRLDRIVCIAQYKNGG